MNKIILIILSFIIGTSIFAFFGFNVYQARKAPIETPKITVTIPEGSTVKIINSILSEAGIISDEEFAQSEEGYLFPDTYEFFLSSRISVVRGKFQDNFKSQIEDILPEGGGELNDILTIASIVEKEVLEYEDKRIVAGIIITRLRNGIPLQMDATLCYTKEPPCIPITKYDKKRDTPYNTYLYRGLPPGPISNPGFDSIKASVNPKESSYLYYISDPATGKTIFASTLDEHNTNVVKYLSN